MNIEILEEQMNKLELDNDYIELCLNYAKKLKDNSLPIIFDVKHMAALMSLDVKVLYSFYKVADKTYKEIIIPKRSGGYREINAPSENLKYIQRWILDNILIHFSCSNESTGFQKNKSIVDNAIKHVNKECVINVDIKDFFPGILFKDVFKIFNSVGYSSHLSMVLTGLCTYKGKLPQGSPASPYISNITCKSLDRRLKVLADQIGADYTRYADDITFSGSKNIAKYLSVIKNIVKEENFIINQKKVRVQYQYHKQMVTGLVVNEKLSVPQKTKKYIRQQIYYSNKFGVDMNLRNQGILKSNYKGHLYGLAYFIKMVEEDCGNIFLKELDNIKWDS